MAFYTYIYLRNNGLPYYVGKGSGDRVFESCPGHYPPKDRSRIQIQHWPSEQIAFAFERYLIDFWGRKDINTGCLHNHTDGGEGASNPPESARKAMRAGGMIGGAKAAKHPKRSEICRAGGKVGGRSAGRLAVETGRLASFRTPEHQRAAAQLSGIGKRREQADKGRHTRWHVDRGVVNPNCLLCGAPDVTLNQTRIPDALTDQLTSRP